ncbi:hypothetical protein LCGC14_2754380, partial [marine sediment metagenome]
RRLTYHPNYVPTYEGFDKSKTNLYMEAVFSTDDGDKKVVLENNWDTKSTGITTNELADDIYSLSFYVDADNPVNYQKFGIDFLKPLVDLKNSKLLGIDNLKKIQEYIDKKENVILLSNHQSEVDPLMIPILSEDKYFSLTSDIISVAGERVILDPLAIPFSMGCSLLCIYSKRYIDLDITKKHQKQIHNKKVMSLMKTLLSEGGKVIYVAPSGGRDRKNKSGKIEIAPFDYKSLEMFYLMGKKAKRKTHFFPFTLATYEIMPPPEKIQIEMGEKRVVNRRAVFISFLNELDMENFPHSDEKDRIKRRKNRGVGGIQNLENKSRWFDTFSE